MLCMHCLLQNDVTNKTKALRNKYHDSNTKSFCIVTIRWWSLAYTIHGACECVSVSMELNLCDDELWIFSLWCNEYLYDMVSVCGKFQTPFMCTKIVNENKTTTYIKTQPKKSHQRQLRAFPFHLKINWMLPEGFSCFFHVSTE